MEHFRRMQRLSTDSSFFGDEQPIEKKKHFDVRPIKAEGGRCGGERERSGNDAPLTESATELKTRRSDRLLLEAPAEGTGEPRSHRLRALWWYPHTSDFVPSTKRVASGSSYTAAGR